MMFRSFALIIFAVALATGCTKNSTGTTTTTQTSTAAATLGDPSHGAEVFRANCAACHATNGAARGIGPSLAREKQRKNYDETVAWIESPDPPMPKLYPSPLSEKDVRDVAAYVQSL